MAFCLLLCFLAVGCNLLPEGAEELLAPQADAISASMPEPISLPAAQPQHPVLCLLPPLADTYTATLATALQDTGDALGMKMTMAAGDSPAWLEALHGFAADGGRVVLFCPGRAISLEMLSVVSEARALGLKTLAYGAPLEDGDANLQFSYEDIGGELGRLAGTRLLEEGREDAGVLLLARSGDPNTAPAATGLRNGLAQTMPEASFAQATYPDGALDSAMLPGGEAATILVCMGSETALLAAEALAADPAAAEGIPAIYCFGLDAGGDAGLYAHIAGNGRIQAACGANAAADVYTLMAMAGQLAENGAAESQNAQILTVTAANAQDFIR